MSLTNELTGEAYCDKCGGDLTPVNLVNAVFVQAMLEDGTARQFHYCKHASVEAGTKNCAAATVLSNTNLKAFRERNPDVTLKLFDGVARTE